MNYKEKTWLILHWKSTMVIVNWHIGMRWRDSSERPADLAYSCSPHFKLNAPMAIVRWFVASMNNALLNSHFLCSFSSPAWHCESAKMKLVGWNLGRINTVTVSAKFSEQFLLLETNTKWGYSRRLSPTKTSSTSSSLLLGNRPAMS